LTGNNLAFLNSWGTSTRYVYRYDAPFLTDHVFTVNGATVHNKKTFKTTAGADLRVFMTSASISNAGNIAISVPA
jgi:hypothetical protein